MKSEQFLEMFRDLEEILALQYPTDGHKRGSPIMEYINDTSNKRYREELNTCREIRNLLTHHADIGGTAIVEPSDEVMQLLERILQYVKRPQTVIEVATPFERLLTTAPEQKVLNLMKKMKERGFSHVPVLRNGKFAGIFSVSVPFAFALENEQAIGDDFTVEDFGTYLDPDNHCTERFLFAARNMTVREAAKEFEIVGNSKKRLAMILVTNSGKAGEPILGVITPFDVLSVKED